MSDKLVLVSAIAILLIIFAVFYFLKKGRINIKYAIVWLLSFGVMLLMVIIPGLLSAFSNMLGFMVPSNMVLAFFIMVLVFINISLTVIISGLNNKVRLLIQEVSMLKDELHNKNVK